MQWFKCLCYWIIKRFNPNLFILPFKIQKAFNVPPSAPFLLYDISIFPGLVVTTSSNTNCQTCEKNEGKCIDFNPADAAVSPRGIFCQCPISRSGKDCEVIHGNFHISATTFCYFIYGSIIAYYLCRV